MMATMLDAEREIEDNIQCTRHCIWGPNQTPQFILSMCIQCWCAFMVGSLESGETWLHAVDVGLSLSQSLCNMGNLVLNPNTKPDSAQDFNRIIVIFAASTQPKNKATPKSKWV